MNITDLQALLRLKRVREQRAAAQFEEARLAEQAAAEKQAGAARMVHAFGVLREAQEGAIYRRLSGKTVSTGRLLAASTNLADLVARNGALRQRVQEAEAETLERRDAMETARAEYRLRQRRAESLDALRRHLHDAARDEAETAQELAQEDITAPSTNRSSALEPSPSGRALGEGGSTSNSPVCMDRRR